MATQTNKLITSDKWQKDAFRILMIHMEYMDSGETAEMLFLYKEKYEVRYDIDLDFQGDAVTVQMHAVVNGDDTLPGYQIAFTIQKDYELQVPRLGEISEDDVTTEDMEFFISDSHLSMQDYLLSMSENMPLGYYILPSPDLSGSMDKALDDLIQ